MFNKIFVDDWIRTAHLWNRKQPLYQLSHYHCPRKVKSYAVIFVYRFRSSFRLPIYLKIDFLLKKFTVKFVENLSDVNERVDGGLGKGLTYNQLIVSDKSNMDRRSSKIVLVFELRNVVGNVPLRFELF